MARTVDMHDPTLVFWESNSLEDHVELIRAQVTKSLHDPETARLARAIVSGMPTIEAWGRTWRNPNPVRTGPEDDMCMINRVWNFYIANVNYVPDPDDFDLFCTMRKTLEAGVGDCDDSTITLGALLKAVGFHCAARVISTDGKRWQHVYLMVSATRGGRRMISLDTTVKDAMPGWEYAKSRSVRDFAL